MHTSGFVMQDQLNPDGHIFIPFPGTQTRLGSGLKAVVQAASTAAIYEFDLADVLFRYGMQDDGQQQYGRPNGTSGAQALALLPGVVDQTPYSRTQRPPVPSTAVFGPNDSGTARTIPKGMQVNAINVVYNVIGGTLTLATIGMTKTTFGTTGTAPVVTTLLANANNGLQTGVISQPVAYNVLIPTPAPITTRLTQTIIEVDMTTPAGVTIDLYGLFLDVSFNFN